MSAAALPWGIKMTRATVKGRTALITGATGGLGQAIALRLAADGLRLVLTDVVAADDFIKTAGLSEAVAYTAPCDLSSEAAVAEFLGNVAAHTTVDVLINNAAHMALIPFDQLAPSDLARFFRVNVEAPFQLAKGLSPTMREKGWGRIVNVVSGSAWQPSPNFVGYISSKMGLIGLTRALAVELADGGICVNAITPALTRHAGNTNALPEPFWEMIRNRQAIKRTGTPEDMMGALSFLASDDAAFMTGQTISVDGGSVFL